jgi:hypothetical protein
MHQKKFFKFSMIVNEIVYVYNIFDCEKFTNALIDIYVK